MRILSTRDVQGYVTELRDAGLSPKTIRNHIYMLSSMINKAMICNWIDKARVATKGGTILKSTKTKSFARRAPMLQHLKESTL